MKKTTIIFLSFLLLAAARVGAHPPRDMVLSYDQASQTLTVQIEHTTRSKADHYIHRLTIFKNDQELPSVKLPRQSRPTGHEQDIAVEAGAGDTLTVKAFCNKGGTKEVTLVIESVEDQPQGE